MAPFVRTIDAFNRAGVSYVIVGGVAAVLHGHLRVTADIDLVVRLDESNARLAVQTLSSLGFRSRLPVDPQDFAHEGRRLAWVRDKHLVVLSFFNPANVLESVDLFAEYPLEYEGLFARSMERDLGGIPARVCSLDDLIAIKRAAGRPIDLDDVEKLTKLYPDER